MGFSAEEHTHVIRELTATVLKFEGLLTATPKDALDLAQTAWATRNLFELRIWAQYCYNSRDRAQRFHDDAIRDARDLVGHGAAIRELSKIKADAVPLDQATEQIQKVLSDLGIEETSKFLDVRKAASELGFGDYYGPLYGFLSKYVHPTALIIFGKSVLDNQAATGVLKSHSELGYLFASKAKLFLAKYFADAGDADEAAKVVRSIDPKYLIGPSI